MLCLYNLLWNGSLIKEFLIGSQTVELDIDIWYNHRDPWRCGFQVSVAAYMYKIGSDDARKFARFEKR